MDKIIVLDFGSQTTQLIARRIREIGVYTEIYPGELPISLIPMEDAKGIVLSGSPHSVYEKDAPVVDTALYETGLPILGICYGLQRITHDFNGLVESHAKTEYGRSRVSFTIENSMFDDVPDGFVSWMSHGDSISNLPDGFAVTGQSEHGFPAAVFNAEKNIYGIQFHPEVTHCEYGNTILKNFAVTICGAAPEWKMETYIDMESKAIQSKVNDKSVLLLISGGVDSTVAAAMLLKALPAKQVHLMYIDTGLMRKNESLTVHENLKKLGAENLHLINAEDRFLDPLEGVDDPEEKRRIIGDAFITIQEEEVKRLGVEHAFLAQGTLYTDMIESGKGVGKKAKIIKSHHNVGTPMVAEKRKQGLLIEPLSMLYKDEVRELGMHLNVDQSIVHRHPFPGPGLAVRILGPITKQKVSILQEVDAIYLRELKARGLYNQIWQAFSVLLPVRSVGVAGDARKYGYVIALRAVVSRDGMTADVYNFPVNHLLEISNLITNTVKDAGRVVYDVSSKPPSTIEWE